MVWPWPRTLHNVNCISSRLFKKVNKFSPTVLYNIAGFVDFDLFGALQICATGVLAAPATIRYSRTYFNTPGRDMYFVWTALNLGGLIAVVVALFRAETVPCQEANGHYISPHDYVRFNTTCSASCNGLHFNSPLRAGQDVVATLPPNLGMTINTACLIGSACCVLAALSLFLLPISIARTNRLVQSRGQWSSPAGIAHGDENPTERVVRSIVIWAEPVMYSLFILVITILGELNLWSPQLRHSIEAMASIGE